MCHVIDYAQKKIELTDKKAVTLALCTEVPIMKPISIFELALIIWNIQSRPCYASEKVPISRIRQVLHELIMMDPRNIIEADQDIFLIKYM